MPPRAARDDPPHIEPFEHTPKSGEPSVKSDSGILKQLRPSIAVAVITLLMTMDLSRPIWWAVPKLADIQFPFRWLSVASVAICPAVAYSLYVFIGKVRDKNIATLYVVAVVIAVSASLYAINELVFDTNYLDRSAFIERIESVRGGPSFPD
ncbi:MAG: hypothetical protein QM785_16570 [Pyrinomonadaceae bacterium]